MTIEQKEKSNVILNIAYKIITTIGIFGILISIGAYKEEIKTLTFDSIEDKVNTKNVVSSTVDSREIGELKKFVGNDEYHIPKSVLDTTYVSKKEYITLVDRLTVTNYQTKEDVKEIRELIRALLKEMKQQNTK